MSILNEDIDITPTIGMFYHIDTRMSVWDYSDYPKFSHDALIQALKNVPIREEKQIRTCDVRSVIRSIMTNKIKVVKRPWSPYLNGHQYIAFGPLCDDYKHELFKIVIYKKNI